MIHCLDSRHDDGASAWEQEMLAHALEKILDADLDGSMFAMLGGYQRILGDNRRRNQWDGVFEKVATLFRCGKAVPLDGPMIGVSFGIRDSDYFRQTARAFGRDRSAIAHLEWMATCWNVTFGASGLWMGKTFEPVSRETFAQKCSCHSWMLEHYDPANTRMGRNFFRQPAGPNILQGLSLPVLTRLWRLEDRPRGAGPGGSLLPENLEAERNIPYDKTGGLFLALPGVSVLEELHGKNVYHLNYRWPALGPVYPMTRLVDEIVQIADGIFLGQLVMATRRYSLGSVEIPLFGEYKAHWEAGEAYQPVTPYGTAAGEKDYGYQNNGYFLMIDPAFAEEAYSDDAFPFLRPRAGESGYRELGYDRHPVPAVVAPKSSAVPDGALRQKFRNFCLEDSPRGSADGDIREELRDGETILEMLQRIQGEIASAAKFDDHVRHFEKLNRLFRRGVAPGIANGLFRGQGQGFNSNLDAPEELAWYGRREPCRGFNYYHGATLNLHFGLADSFCPNARERLQECDIFPSALLGMFHEERRGPNLLDAIWATIGRFIFPWAGKSFEAISGRKLSMLLDESPNLEERYPERVEELRAHPASWPHYDLVRRSYDAGWTQDSPYAAHLRNGPWDQGMPEEDCAFWRQEAATRWVLGYNLQDARILAVDSAMRVLDMNYRDPLPSIHKLADAGPSPFVRQGYMFLGTSQRESILSMNNGPGQRKQVFQFHYRYPLIGGPVPIGLCLDELVEIAAGLFLGQLIYATAVFAPFHSSVDPAEYQYQLFGYFLLLDNDWERHRRVIGLDIDW